MYFTTLMMKPAGMLRSLVLIVCAVTVTCQSFEKFQVVLGVFSPHGTDWELRTSHALHLLNVTDRLNETHLEVFYFTEALPTSLDEARTVTQLLESKSVSVMLAPSNAFLSLIADDIRLPYLVLSIPDSSDGSISSHFSSKSLRSTDNEAAVMTTMAPLSELSSYSFHFLPQTDVIHLAVGDLIQAFEWTDQVAVMYDSAQGLHLLGDLMTIQVANQSLKIHGWPLSYPINAIEIRDHLFRIRRQEISQIVVHCRPEMLEAVLQVGLRLSMLSATYSWVSAGLDTEIDLTPYLDSSVNFTMFQLVGAQSEDTSSDEMSLLEAVTYDGLDFLLDVIKRYSHNMSTPECSPFCSAIHTVPGVDLASRMSAVRLTGKTGNIHFGDNNFRSDVHLNIRSLINGSIDTLGRWEQYHDSWRKRTETRPYATYWKGSTHPLRDRDIKIVTIVEQPFVMLKKDHKERRGNDRFEGFLIDLIEEISRQLFIKSYTLYESPDGNYGAKVKDEWNGMIKELLIGNASMCLGAISITSERESAVDFSKPFKQKMFNMLMKKPKEQSSVFQFLWPLAPLVWILIISSMVLSSVVLFLMDKISPNNVGRKGSRFNLVESMWFMYGSLVGAGTDIVPRTISGRLLTAAWWFFALILVSSYTANLAAFLTVTKIETPIKTVADLEKQNIISYGTVKNTYSSSMFRDSKVELFQKMHTYMTEISPSSMVESSDVGFEKVKEGNYAFIWDAPINKYEALHNCDVMTVGEPFDEKGYGIGVPPRAPYRDDISMAILHLSESGTMQTLEHKWWGNGPCVEFKETSTSNTKELDLSNVAGIFFVLLGGAGLAFLVSLLEMLVTRARGGMQKEGSPDSGNDRDDNSTAVHSPLFANSQMQYFNKESNL